MEVNTNNYCCIKGTIYRDPQVRYSASGMAWASFMVAVPTDNGKSKHFITCKAFGQVAEEFEKMARKDAYITLEGKITSGSYVARDGHKVYTQDVVADKIDYSQGLEPSKQDQESAQVPMGFEETDDPFPF